MHLLLQWLAKLAEQENFCNAFCYSDDINRWREHKDHFQGCYFCLVNAKRFSSKYRKKITYPNIDSALRHVPHDPSMPAPLPPEDGLASLANEVVFDEDSNLALSDSTGSEDNQKQN